MLPAMGNGVGVVGVALMIVAALLNATASVLQRHGARTEPESTAFSLELIVDLIRRPVWILGILAMVCGFVLHGVAISLSRISLVQPLLVTELPFTLILASRALGLNIPKRDWLAIALQSVGLAAFLGCLDPVGGDPRVPTTTWVLGVGITLILIAGLVVLGYFGRAEHRAAMLGTATGAAFGLNSALIAGVGATVSHGGGLFTAWQTYGIAILGPTSFFLLQNALHAGNLVASQPGFTLTNPLVSVAWGLWVFGEHGRHGAFLLGAFAGAALITVGTFLLARSDLLDPNRSQR